MDRAAVKLGLELATREKNTVDLMSMLGFAVELNPLDANLRTTLGDLQYQAKDFAKAEASLLEARKNGASSPRISEELGRIRLQALDYSAAAPYIDESLKADPSQQSLWILAADIASHLNNTEREAESLERGLALGGLHVDLRTRLVRLYLAHGDLANAARNVDLELPNIPSDADTQSTWAQFYEDLHRPDDALACWRRAIKSDPRREAAQFAAIRILLDRKAYPDVLTAADEALDAVVSPRLQLARATALEKLDRIYEARLFLETATATATTTGADLDLLKHAAETADVFGGDAPGAWRRYVTEMQTAGRGKPELKAELKPVLERGLRVSARENDSKNVEWFAAQISAPAARSAAGPDAKQNGVWIPGGLDALMFAAWGNPGSSPARFMADYARTVLNHEAVPQQATPYQHAMSDYFTQLSQLLAMCVRKGDQSSITLSITDKKLQKQTESVLDLFGWKLRRTKDGLNLESGVKASQSRKQDLPSALAADQAGIEQAFREGKPYVLEIPWQWAPLAAQESAFQQDFQTAGYPGGLAEAMVRDPNLAKLYVGLSNLDRETTNVLITAIGLRPLAARYADRFALYSSALAVSGSRVVTPGGPAADAIWTGMVGASPANAPLFLRSLLDKDDGKLLAWFFTLSQLDFAHQRFFTLNANRTRQYYELFADSPDLRAGAGRLMRAGSFSGFLREIPLTEGSVDFPGSAEVWMVAKGTSKSATKTQALLKKVHKAVAPEVEDEILLRLARTRYSLGNDHVSELDNFLAVVRIEAHRKEPLDEESALALAQNFSEAGAFYPYFAVFPDLTGSDFKAFFAFAEKLKSANPVDADLILAQFDSLVELTHLGTMSGKIPEESAVRLFRDICNSFLAAPDIPAYTSAALGVVRQLVRLIPGGEADPDRAIAELVLGGAAPVDLEWDHAPLSIDAAKSRSIGYGRVLDLQRITALAPLLRLESAGRAIAAGAGSAALIEAMQKDGAALLAAEVSKKSQAEGKARQDLARTNSMKLPEVVAEAAKKISQKKVNPKELERLDRDLLAALAPQVRVALSGIVYAAWLNPNDILVANDPQLVRKHQFVLLDRHSPDQHIFAPAELNVAQDHQGSYFSGGFARFAAAVGEAAALGSHQGNANSALYAAQMASMRATPWELYRDSDQQLLGLRLRIAREWCVYAADDPALLRDLSEDSFGILSLSRRRELLNAIESRNWDSVWRTLTLSDLFFLSGRYLARYEKSPWNSALDTALRNAARSNDGARLNILGAVMPSIYGCNHPHMVNLAPYEEYERHLFPVEMAQRTSEMKLYLSTYLDRIAITAALLPAIAEPAVDRVFKTLQMSDERDWSAAIKAFNAIDAKTISAALRTSK